MARAFDQQLMPENTFIAASLKSYVCLVNRVFPDLSKILEDVPLRPVVNYNRPGGHVESIRVNQTNSSD
tara:strand:+ start:142 stop:348 length:207 start_codon:yes stop_codon:yes gene_type:complete